jgi:hypothetical protein
VPLWVGPVLVVCALASPGMEGAGGRPPAVVVIDGDVRLRRADADEARRVGQLLSGTGDVVTRAAQRGETIAFQIALLAADAPLARVALALSDPVGPGGARLRTALFREHYLQVAQRSRNERRPDDSLGWRAGARPSDVAMKGEVPDALVPIAVDMRPIAPPRAAGAGGVGAFWVDVEVPDDAPPGRYEGSATVDGDGAGAAPSRFSIAIDVRPTPLPFRAASVFVYYEPDRLIARTGAAGGAVERQLWQLLHAHQVDALAPLTRLEDVERLAAAYDGSLFTDGPGYHGPGVGRPPAVVALGAYGALGAPSPDALARVHAMVTRMPSGPELFLYAIDESCESPRAADWKRALAGHPPLRPVAVAQTCGDPPDRQAADIAMLPAPSFSRATPAAARAAGRRAFIYNGVLPGTGTMLLDADPRGLVANGWIAAAMAIERWFYWESTFWDDDNRGGHGPIDPFVTAESFHNRDGDAALGDGLVLYPGRQQRQFAASSLGTDAVFPSIRLKAIRRGIQDAGLIALAAREQPEETARLIARALPAALDEADPARPASWETAPLSFEAGRAALRALVTRDGPMTEGEIRAAFDDLAERRRRAVPLAPVPARGLRRLPIALIGALAAALTLGFAARARYSRRRRS